MLDNQNEVAKLTYYVSCVKLVAKPVSCPKLLTKTYLSCV